MKNLLILGLCLLGCLSLSAQNTFTVEGTLTDASGTGLANENITIIGYSTCVDSLLYFTTTNSNGYYNTSFDIPCTDGAIYAINYSCNIPITWHTFDATTPVITADLTCDISCNMNAFVFPDSINNTISSAVSGGNPPYTFDWSDGQNMQNISISTPGTYCVTITDVNACTATQCAVIGSLGGPICSVAIDTTYNPNSLEYAFNAIASGTAPYSYFWDTGQSTQIIYVSSGTHCVTITDAAGCVNYDCATVSNNGGGNNCSVYLDSIYQAPNGAFDLTAYGSGMPPYTYQWSNGQIGQNISVFDEGLYCVTITDADGCDADACVNVVANTTFTTVNINGTLNYSNGVPLNNNTVNVYGYSGCADSIFTGTITNMNGYYNTSFTVNCDTGTMWVVPIDCDAPTNVYWWGKYTNNFTVDFECASCDLPIDIYPDTSSVPTVLNVNINGGVAPFTYSWSDGSSSPVLHAVFQNTYCVTVEDATGCVGSTCYNYEGISGPCIDLMQVDSTIGCTADFDPVCGCDGVVYSNSCVAENWFGVTSWISGACQGNCQVNIDVLPVVNTADLYLLSPIASFGVAPFTYEWSTGEIANEIYVDQSGTYCVTITDADGCAADDCALVTVNSNLCLDASLIDWNTVCTAVYDPVCGCDSITYENACIAENYYGVTVWASGACNSGTSNDPDCMATLAYNIDYENNDSLVTVFFTGNGGNGNNYFYYWEFSDGSTSQIQDPIRDYILTDSFYTFSACLTAYDNAQCTTRVCETIVIPLDPDGLINGQITEADGLVDDRDKDIYRGSGGDPLPNVTVLLLDAKKNQLASTLTNNNGEYSFSNLAFGTYYIQVNIAGIMHEPYLVELNPVLQELYNLDFKVSDSEVLSNQEITFANNIDIFPNPTTDLLNIHFDLQKASNLTIQLTNLLGQQVIQNNYDLSGKQQAIQLNMSDLGTGIYILSIQNEEEIFTQKVVKK